MVKQFIPIIPQVYIRLFYMYLFYRLLRWLLLFHLFLDYRRGRWWGWFLLYFFFLWLFFLFLIFLLFSQFLFYIYLYLINYHIYIIYIYYMLTYFFSVLFLFSCHHRCKVNLCYLPIFSWYIHQFTRSASIFVFLLRHR